MALKFQDYGILKLGYMLSHMIESYFGRKMSRIVAATAVIVVINGREHQLINIIIIPTEI